MSSRLLAWGCSLMVSAPAAVLWGQDSILNAFNPLSGRSGVQVYGVSLFSSYYSSGSPLLLTAPLTNQVPPDVYAGTSVSLGWIRSGPRSATTANYSGTYLRAVRHSDTNILNHQFSLGWNTNLARKWNWGVSTAGVVSNLEQLLFAPTLYSNLASLPTTFDELAAAVLAGRFSNIELSTLLSRASLMSSPERSFVYGSRVLSASLQTTLSYARSDRSSFHFSGFGTRTQHLRQNRSARELFSPYMVPQTTTAGGTVGWSYSLSPRTHIGLTGSTSRVFSRFQDAWASYGTFSIGRTMSRRWFVQGSLGAGELTYVGRRSVGPRGVQYTAAGSIGYKTLAHTLLASYHRSIGDAYGIGAGSTTGATGAWTWRRPGRPWSVSSTVGYQKLGDSMLQRTESWSATAALTRSLSRHLFLSVQYGYFQLPPYFSRENLTQNGVTVAITWSPSLRR